MSYKISGGEYALDSGGRLIKSEYTDSLAQSALLALITQRRRFYPDKSYGSYIHGEGREPLEEYILAFARQALGSFDGVFAKSAQKDGQEIKITLIINGSEKEVILPIEEDIQ